MQYLLGLTGEEPNFEEISPDEMQATIDVMDRYNQELRDAGALIYAAGLRERATATVVRFPLEEAQKPMFRLLGCKPGGQREGGQHVGRRARDWTADLASSTRPR